LLWKKQRPDLRGLKRDGEPGEMLGSILFSETVFPWFFSLPIQTNHKEKQYDEEQKKTACPPTIGFDKRFSLLLLASG